MNTINNYNNTIYTTKNNEDQKISEQIASGSKLNSAADNASMLAISEKLEAAINGLSQGTSNTYSAIDMAQTADGAMSNINDMLGRQRELVLQSMNGILSDDDRANIQYELDSLNDEINSQTENSQYNNKQLLTDQDLYIQTGANAGDGTTISFSDLSTDALGTSTINVMDLNSAMDSLKNIDSAIDNVTGSRAEVGSQINTLNHITNYNQINMENTISTKSLIADTDMAEAVMQSISSSVLEDANAVLMAQSQELMQSQVAQLLDIM